MSPYNVTIDRILSTLALLTLLSLAWATRAVSAPSSFTTFAGVEADFNGLTPALPLAVYVTNSSSSGDCTFASGTGTIKHWCLWDGSAWIAAPGDGTAAANSFETMLAPLGTDPMADNPTDSLNLLTVGLITITGDSALNKLTFENTSLQWKKFNVPTGGDVIASSNADTVSFDDEGPLTITSNPGLNRIEFDVTAKYFGRIRTPDAVDVSAVQHPTNFFDTVFFRDTGGMTITGNNTTKEVFFDVVDWAASGAGTIHATNYSDTNANTLCSGTTTYLDGEGNCDDLDPVYEAELNNSAGLLAALSDEVGTGFSLFNIAPSMVTSLTVNDGFWAGIGVALERIIFDAAGDITIAGANFGVGTTTVSQELHVKSTDGGNVALRLEGGNGTSTFDFFVNNASDRFGISSVSQGVTVFQIGNDGALDVFTSMTVDDDFSLGIGPGLEEIIFDTAGDISVMGANFGIGTTGALATLHVNGTTAAVIINGNDNSNMLDFRVAGASEWIQYIVGGDFRFFESGSGDRVTFLAGGDVGIGTTAPGVKLDVAGHIGMRVEAADPSTATNTAHVYVKDVASSGEVFAQDEAGNVTQISPHDPVTGDWIFFSHNTKTGRMVRVNMERMIRKLEELTGETFIEETWELSELAVGKLTVN